MSQTTSLVTVAIDLYSDSIEDLDTTCYFLLFQEISESPKNTQKPVIGLLVLGQAAQSTSQYDFNCNSDLADRNKP